MSRAKLEMAMQTARVELWEMQVAALRQGKAEKAAALAADLERHERMMGLR